MLRDLISADFGVMLADGGSMIRIGGRDLRALVSETQRQDPLEGTVRETRVSVLRADLPTVPDNGAPIMVHGRAMRVAGWQQGPMAEVVDLICIGRS